MKFTKISMFLAIAAVLTSTSIVLAKNDDAGRDDSETSKPEVSELLRENSVENKDEVKTQNKGEETMLQVKTEEKENLGNLVSQKIQELLDDESLEKGIGQEVKKFIHEQKQIQDRVQSDLDTAGKRSGVLKSLIGPDYKALKNAKTELEQNQMRIKNLEELKLKLTNQADITMVTETIQALVDQNTTLQDNVAHEGLNSITC